MKKKNKQRVGIQPIMSYILLIIGVIIFSGIFALLDFQSTYYSISSVTYSFSPITENITSLFSLSGLKYIFENTVANFATFTVLTHIIILLIGISIMERSGFLKTAITMLTKKAKRRNVTFVFVLLCILSSIMGDLSYIIFIPLGALLFLYGKRNPATGIICAFASLSCGTGINLFLSSTDSTMLNYTKLAALTINDSYNINRYAFMIIMAALIILASIVITYVTENMTVKKVPRFDFDETTEDDEIIITNARKRGMLFAGIASFCYLLFFIYNIIPGLPLSGNLLDYSQTYYIDKLFSPDSFFSSGFVFIVTVLFVILGLFYGLGARTIKNHKDFCDYLSHSLDGIGNMLVMIFFASTFISIFKHSNIGDVIVSWFANIIGNSNFNGMSLIVLMFILVAIGNIFVPSSASKWLMMSATVVPTFMSAGITPEFTQVIFRLAESSTMNITPILAYFIIYFAYLEKYNQNNKRVKFKDAFKYQLPYTAVIAFVYIAIIIVWYIIGIPLGINTYPTL